MCILGVYHNNTSVIHLCISNVLHGDKHSDTKGDGKQAQINENQDFVFEAIGISSVPA